MPDPEWDESDVEIPSEVVELEAYSIVRYRDGREYKLYGYGSGKRAPLDLDPRIDLTKPIYEQALKAWEADRRAARHRTDEAA